ncbi:MAG TPA: hypothetical protein H9774_12020 [Candidatus Desulfovibrio gallistercoris]|nr:hypothetical protein [Candidatus Desulfovibrio gallistercoris]
MTDRLLRDRDVAAMLGTTPGVAASILAQRGVHAVDFGMGRGRGRRWLESAVQQVIAELHAEAQPQKRTKAVRPAAAPSRVAALATMSVSDLHRLTQAECVQ